MIKTSLPYDMNQMDEIRTNGAIVDMSEIRFPGMEAGKQQRVSFVFLRNTGFNVKLDFSKCSFEDKEVFLLSYLTENIDVKQSELATSYIKILNRVAGNEVDIECILTDEEINQFIERNGAFITKVFQLIKSLPLFAMAFFSLNNEVYTMDDFEKTEDDTIKVNFAHVALANGFLLLFDYDTEEPPLFYSNLFTADNEELLTAVKELPFFSILCGLCTAEINEWNSMIEASNALDDSLQKGERVYD